MTSESDADAVPASGEPRSHTRVRSLLAGNYPVVRRFLDRQCGRWLRIRESISDLAQSVYREALSSLSQFRGRDRETRALRHYLLKIAKHKIANRRRYWIAARRDPDRERPLDQLTGTGAEASSLGDSHVSVVDAEHAEKLEHLRRILDGLPDDYREIILLARAEQLSHAEIARRMGRSEVAVRKLLSRALARVARELRGS